MTLNDIIGCVGLKEDGVATGNRFHMTAPGTDLTEHILKKGDGLISHLSDCDVQQIPRSVS